MSELDKLPRYYLATDYAGENPRMEERTEPGFETLYFLAEDVRDERRRLREKVEALRGVDLRPPLAKDGYLLALKDVLALLAEPGETGSA